MEGRVKRVYIIHFHIFTEESTKALIEECNKEKLVNFEIMDIKSISKWTKTDMEFIFVLRKIPHISKDNNSI